MNKKMMLKTTTMIMMMMIIIMIIGALRGVRGVGDYTSFKRPYQVLTIHRYLAPLPPPTPLRVLMMMMMMMVTRMALEAMIAVMQMNSHPVDDINPALP